MEIPTASFKYRFEVNLQTPPYPHITPFSIRRDAIDNGLIVHGSHQHLDFYALYIVRRGRGMHTIDDDVYFVARGDVYLMAPGQVHSFRGFEGIALDAVYFLPALLTETVRSAIDEVGGLPMLNYGEIGGRILHLSPAAHTWAADTFDETLGEWSNGTLAGAVLARCLCIRLLIHLARLCAVRQAGSPAVNSSEPGQSGSDGYYHRTVASALNILDERFSEPLRIDAIAEELSISPSQLTRQFTAGVGRSPRDYLTALRMDVAKSLLAGTDLSVGEVGARCGFLDANYFTRAFHSVIGESPSSYRRSRKNAGS